MFLEKFKTEVYKHPCIYDRTAFKDPIRRKTAWNKVAEAIIGDDKWREMTNKQREMKVKSLKSKWQMMQRKLKQPMQKDVPAKTSKHGNILRFFKQGKTSANHQITNQQRFNDSMETITCRTEKKYNTNNVHAENENKELDEQIPSFLDTSERIITENKEDETEGKKKEEDKRHESSPLSLLPKYELLKAEDKLQLHARISQWIEERLDSYNE